MFTHSKKEKLRNYVWELLKVTLGNKKVKQTFSFSLMGSLSCFSTIYGKHWTVETPIYYKLFIIWFVLFVVGTLKL
jgi:hypothetical protein